MDRQAILERLDVFPADGAKSVLLDRVQLSFRSSRLGAAPSVPRHAFDWAPPIGSPAKNVYDSAGVRVLQWTDADGTVQQYLGRPRRRGRHCVTQVVHMNPLRAWAESQRRFGHSPRSLRHEDSNYVDPAIVEPTASSNACLAILVESACARVPRYVQGLRELFGVPAQEEDVRVSVSSIELTWDVSCSIATYAPQAFWPGWCMVMPEPSRHPPSLLKAFRVKGERYKLYRKADRVLRFEACLSSKRVRHHLGRALNPLSPSFLDDVRLLGHHLYGQIIEVQSHLWDDGVVAPLDLCWAAMSDDASRYVRPVIEGLLAGGFHNAGGHRGYSRVLHRLREAGHVAYLGSGRYRLQPDAARGAHWLLRRAIDLGLEAVKP